MKQKRETDRENGDQGDVLCVCMSDHRSPVREWQSEQERKGMERCMTECLTEKDWESVRLETSEGRVVRGESRAHLFE